ncbi:MAG: nucleoside-diphosphate kinase, partial [Patescibacteria group bacterium]
MDYAFGLLKPDCLRRGLEREIMLIIGANGLPTIASKRVRLTKKEVDIVWPNCINEPYYPSMLAFSTSSDCLAFIVTGDDAISRLHELVGHYDPAKARPDTIRGRYATSCMENLIHSADTVEDFWLQTRLFFTINFT